MADPLAVPLSRLFIVCGRAVEEETLRSAFSEYGNVQHVKVIKDKGVAYVKFDKASSAALAMENLNGAVLNNGRGPKLKVMLAEEPTQRGAPAPPPRIPDEVLASDPDNIPPRSRLFVVVPKAAEAQVIQDEVSKLGDGLEYVKTDLIAPKGVVFAKYSKASAALKVLEEVGSKGTLGPYKVKIMLAEPKTKRSVAAAAALGAAAAGLPGVSTAAGLRALESLGLGAHVGLQHAALLAHQGKVPDLYGLGMPLDHSAAYRHLAAVAASGALGGGAVAHHTAAAAAAAAAATTSGLAAQHAQLLAAGDMALHSLAGGALGLGPEALGGEQVGGPLAFNHGGGGSGFGGPFGGPLGGTEAAGAAAGPSGAHHSSGRGFGGEGVMPSGVAAAPGHGIHSSPGNASSMGSGSSSLSSFPPPAYPVRALSPATSASAGTFGAGCVGAVGMPPGSPSPSLSSTRLFVVCSKSIDDALLARLFRSYPGMEYCDLKRDRATGRSKGYAYINYSSPGSAAAAVRDLNGIEFPPGSGCRLKVMPAEILGAGGTSAVGATAADAAGCGSGGSSSGGSAGLASAALAVASCSTPIIGGAEALAGLGGSAGSLRGSTSSFCGAVDGRPPPSPALVSTGRAPGPASSAAPSPALDRGLPDDLAAVQDELSNMTMGRSGGSSLVARELMFNMA